MQTVGHGFSRLNVRCSIRSARIKLLVFKVPIFLRAKHILVRVCVHVYVCACVHVCEIE